MRTLEGIMNDSNDKSVEIGKITAMLGNDIVFEGKVCDLNSGAMQKPNKEIKFVNGK